VADLTNPSRVSEYHAHWDRCRVSVRAYLSGLLANRSDIEDCVQEVALIAWKKGPVGEGERAFLGHCLATARLIGLAASRKISKSRVQFLPPEVALSLAEEVMDQEQADPLPNDRILALRVCLSTLDEHHRQLLALRYAGEGRTRLDQAAKGEGKTLDALYKKLERLRASLRNCVTRRMEGGGEQS
jgi:RNA polymerase sigma-70 factor (ECF subfamily)